VSNLLAADVLLILHVSFVAFVVFGLVLIIAGGLFDWSWVRNRLFRIVHLLCIGVVVVQSWFGVICPMTTWEMALREKGGDASYEGSFISHWLGELLYYEAPAWAFALAYTLFGVVVVLSWYWVRPR
jgi:hypothetical protein